ncbi:hypothetical protein BGX23_012463 [Mortierella sp. AD031]|nr:hypothetical protein BGX23_012463 [Mortierella sp. AD031]KAG0198944.1 hypothetical protein BGX33_011967 [Mortierella sp. NVP41]
MTVTKTTTDYSKVIDIGNGLIMRWSTKADTDDVVQLVGDSFRWLPIGDPLPEYEIPGPHEALKAGARRLLSGKTSVMSEHDYALVEDTNNKAKGRNPIVACVSLHEVPVHYGSVNLVFGKPELIATEPSYRNKGLVRRLIHEMVHPASEARGHVLQFIPGIQYFYRQFGYEYGLMPLTSSRIDSPDLIPSLAPNQQEPYLLRQASLADIPFLNRLSTLHHLQTQCTIGTLYTPEYWQYAVHDSFEIRQSRFDADRQTLIIEEVGQEGAKAVGWVSMSHTFFGAQVEAIALNDGVHYVDVANPTLRQLFVHGKERQTQKVKAFEEFKKEQQEKLKNKDQTSTTSITGESTSATEETQAATTTSSAPVALSLALHPNHPLLLFLGTKATRQPVSGLPGFRLYTRINSYPLFLSAVRSELEHRLAQSPAVAGISGRLRLDFFRQVEGNSSKGLEIILERGRILKIHDWAKPSPEDLLAEKVNWKKDETEKGVAVPEVYFATFSPLTFTQLVTGKQSLEELIWSYGENSVKDDTSRLLLNTLFPKAAHSLDFFNW